MVTQKTTKGLQCVSENPRPYSLSRQASSFYNLTLDEVQTHLGNLGKPLGSMNLDELLKTICTDDHPIPTHVPSGSWSPLNATRQSSFSLSQDLSKKTVEEVWREIEQGKKHSRNDAEERQKNLGEMTLESFLNEAGVIADSNNAGSGSHPEWNQFQMLPQHQSRREMPVFMPSLELLPANGDSAYLDMSMSPSNMMIGNLSDTQPLGRKRTRTAPGEVVVERRQKRMIKNRESAARSRARKQAYTQELELKISQLEEENERLKRTKELESILPSAPPPEPKYQLRRTSSSTF